MSKSVLAAAGLVFSSLGLIGAASAPAPAPAAETPKIDLGILKAQVILDHLAFGPGVLDGRMGLSTVSAIKGFQETRGLKQNGKLDQATVRALSRYDKVKPTRTLLLTVNALSGPYTYPMPDDPAKQAKLDGLHYRSPMEKLAEMFHTTPEVLLALNSPETKLSPGTPVVFPNALPISRDYDPSLPEDWRATLNMLNVDANQPEGAKIVVDKSDSVLRVLDEDGKLVAQFTATMGSTHDPLPIGQWKINGPDYNPKFHYNPDLFWDAEASDDEALLPPGPNGPVGVIWLDLSKPHYGIHGTGEPTTIGRAESHGCIRLTNWDAARLSMMVKPGTPAIFQP